MTMVAIIGGGPAGIASAVQAILLAEASGVSISIKLFDQGKHYYGRSFDTADKKLLLNTSVGVTSIVPGEPNHMLEFLRSSYGTSIEAGDFIERSKAAHYIKSTLATMAASSHVTSVQILQEQVVDLISPRSGHVVIKTDKGDHIADKAVIATGRPFQCLPRVNDLDTIMAFPGDEIQNVPGTEPVAVVGSSLGAVDSVISLLRNGHEAPIIMISPSGRLPAVRRSLVHDPNQTFMGEIQALRSPSPGNYSVDDILRLLCLLGGDSYRHSFLLTKNRDPSDEFLDCCSESESGTTDWEVHMMAVIDAMNEVWPTTTQVQRQRHILSDASRIRRFISSMPLKNALILKEAILDGQLVLHKGSISCTSDVSNVLEPIGIRPTTIVVALGCSPASTDPLIAQLVRNGLLKLNAEGGVEAVRGISTSGTCNVCAVGPVTHGRIYTPNFLYSSVRDAAGLSRLFRQEPMLTRMEPAA